ncbi:Glycolate oxidase subunit glcD [Desulfamplus magnetovallimortis]|uniref:Glycolate oxidase subunit glcD n=2 Tax=Desulfamplus magnetovallimortis TaxID=1246637 RepID=A0A1W1HCB0_9BACT|nr:Glycolate oxidase subunit glcD [Desulfamplus magnetovallimortis]
MADIKESIYRELVSITNGHVTREPEELCCYSYDATGRFFLPHAVVFPAVSHEVAEIVKIAAKEGIPLIPRGSGSGMTGGSLPVKGGIVIATSRMNRIIEIDDETLVARVEPGVITGNFHHAVEKKGLFYPPDPASSSFCTIGGNLGECAGGPRAVKYGVTRDYVLGLEAVLPSGNIINTGVKTAKGVAGYDLTRLIVGSEGTLAIVTQATLKLLPLPEAVKTMAALFPSIHKAASAVSSIIKDAVIPRCVEFLDRSSIACVRDRFGFHVPDDIEAILIIEVDGSCGVVEEDGKNLETFCVKKGANRVITAADKAEASTLWAARKALSSALFRMAPDKINEDIVVPINRIPEMVLRIERIQKRTGLPVVSFGHAGDGNIHCNIMYDKRYKDAQNLAESAVDELFEATLELGGTITGEHGVGITKMKYLPREIRENELKIMRGIKAVFDPGNILNPGKIF